MRIISGTYKNKKLFFLNAPVTRPLKDSVKENIFNIISHSNLIKVNIKQSNVLDLYSGVGSFGIECLSRGSKNVTFVDADKQAIKLIKKNLDQIPVGEKTLVFDGKIEKFFNSKYKNSKFDIIFFDPPFNDIQYTDYLSLIKKLKIYSPTHIVIIHRDRKTNENLNKFIKILDTKNYGRSKIIFGLF